MILWSPLLSGRLHAAAFCPPFDFYPVFNALGCQFALHQAHKIVDQTDELRLDLLGGGAAGPGFGLLQFVFEFIKDFFNIPPHAIQQRDETGGQGHFISDELVSAPALWVSIGDLAQQVTLSAAAHLLVGFNAVIKAVGAIPWALPATHEGKVLLATADEVDAVLCFVLMPEFEVDARRIPDEEGLASSRDAFAQRLGSGTFDGADVVFLFALQLIAQHEVAQQVSA